MPSSVNSSLTPSVAEQGGVLLGQRVLRLAQDATEIVGGQRAELDPDRKAALQFGNQVGGLGQRERARGDEQDVVGSHDAVLGRHRRAFDQRQQVALHAFATDAGAAELAALGNLVDLVDEDDAVLLAVLDRLLLDLLVVDQLAGFFLDQQRSRLGDAQLALLRAAIRTATGTCHAAGWSFPPCPAAP